MKRLLSTLFVILYATSFLGYTYVTRNGVKYIVFKNEQRASVSGPEDRNCKVIEIQKEVDGYKVDGINPAAFENCTNLTSVTIPSSVTYIGISAFNGCSSLASVTIPESVTDIGSHAFSGCSSLTSITIPENVISLGSSAFADCGGLTLVTLNSNSVVSKAYTSDNNLGTVFGTQVEEYVLGNNITSIRNNTFCGCSNLTSVTIPESVTTIGVSAFYGCSNLSSVTIPENVTNLGSSAFADCGGLTLVTLNSNSVVSKVYTSDNNLGTVFGTQVEEYILGDNITHIGPNTFSGCINLTSVTIPKSVTYIGVSAFYGCSNLSSVTIPESVTTLGSSAFRGCSSLISVTIPNNLQCIESLAFADCSSLTLVTIPNSVTYIDNWAFLNCISLKEVICMGAAPAYLYLHKYSFDNIHPDAVLYAPMTETSSYSKLYECFKKVRPYITDLKQLTESKQYYIRANRGALGVANGELATTNPNAQSRKCEQPAPFAILQWNDYYCLYSTVDGKYITANGGETDTPSDAAFWKLFRTDDSVRFIFQRFGYPAILNTNDSYGITIDGWTTADDGNMFMICEADVFSPVDIPFVVRPNVTGKIFTLNCKRGYVGCNNGHLCGTTQDKASRFAVIDYNGTNYLYDVTNQAFVCHSTAAKAGNTGNLLLESNTNLSKAVTGLSWGKTPFATYPWHLEDSFGNWLNMDGQPNVYMNTWKDYENGNGGNTYWLEIADYDYSEAETEAIEILNQYYQISGKSFVLSYNDGNDKLYVGYSSYYEDYRTYPSDGPSRFAIVHYKGLGFLYDVEKKVFFKGDGAVTLRKARFSDQDYYEFEGYSGKKLGLSKDDGHILEWYDVSVQDNYVNLFMAESIEDFDATEAVQKLKGGNYTFYTFVEPDGNIVRTMGKYSYDVFSTLTGVPDEQRKDYCSYFMPPATIADGKNEITALVSYNLPFTVSTDYLTATWYLARIRDNYYINMSNSEPYYPKATRDTNFNFLWAFQGTPHTGFVILNNAAGPYKVLTKVGDYAVMRSGSEERWELIQNGDGFSFLRMGSEMDYINQNGGNTGPLGFWVSDWARTDKGSQWLIEEISTGIEEIQESERPVQGETGVWYTLDGRKLDAAMPDRKGIYIINGRKVVVR